MRVKASPKQSPVNVMDCSNLFQMEKMEKWNNSKQNDSESPASSQPQTLIGSKRPRRAVKRSRYDEENYVS